MPVNSCTNVSKSASTRVFDPGYNYFDQLKKQSGANRYIDFEPCCEIALNLFANIAEGKDSARGGRLNVR